MSTVIYSEDFISITWEIKEYKTENIIDEDVDNLNWKFAVEVEEEQEYQEQLHLIFTIQVNGKLKNFEWSFTLEKDSLKDWGEWYAVLNLLTSLGYKIGDYEQGKLWWHIIQNWIDRLYENKR